VPPRAQVAAESFSAAPGNAVNMNALAEWLESNGFVRAGTVRETGEYAVRGGILDLYAPSLAAPIRLDFFGDTLESIRAFDPETQRSTGTLRSLDIVPMSEVRLTTESIRRFRQSYVAAFGAPQRDDRLYEAVSEGRRYPGLEHWLPLFHERLDTVFDYVPDVPVIFDALVEDAAGERLAQVQDYFDARNSAMGRNDLGAAPYRPLPPERLYMAPEEWAKRVADLPLARHLLSPKPPSGSSSTRARVAGATSSPSGRTRTPTCSRPRSPISAR
jgi:transcription-repair coupling factor (superfamily II helicase)